MDNPNFTLSKENETKVTKEELEFILGQAETLLTETISSSDSVVNRSTLLLTLLLGILSSLIGFYFANHSTLSASFQGSIIITAGYVIIIIVRLYFNLKGDIYKVAGEHPKYLLNDWFFENSKNHDQRLNRLLLIMIESYQERISYNRSINQPRWEVYGLCMFLSLIMPVIFLAGFLVFTLAGL
jgi:hypothetical protein